MIKVSLRGLAGRKLRAVLTGIAIVLGVAMISGTYILTDTVDSAFTSLLVDSYAGTDAVVTGKGLDISIDGDTPPSPPVDESLLDVVRGVDGVALATGSVLDETSTKILTAEGEAISSEGWPTLGFGLDTDPAMARFNPLNLDEGRWPASADEVVIDAGTVDKQGFAIGDKVEISTLEPKQPFELVGVAKYGEVDSLGAISFTVFTIPTAQELLGREGQYDAISVAARDGISQDELVAAIAPVLPADAEVVSAAAEAKEQSDEVSEFTAIFRYFLLAFAAIALFVGAFVIFNTFSITVAQRTREFATLRTIGASRRQVLGSVILESLVIGLLASLVGLGLGVLLASGIEALFSSLGVDLPTADRVFATRTVVVSLLVGVGITLLAGLFPAIRATRVPPIAAVREGATLPRSRFARFTPWIAGVVVVLALLALARAMFVDELGTSDRLLSIAGGVLLLFLGVAMLASHLVTPIATGGRPSRAYRGRGSGPAGERKRRTQSESHGGDRCSADDRHRARRVHRDADERDEGVEPRGDRGAGHRRLRGDVAGRLHAVRRRGRRRARRVLGARGRHERPLQRRAGRRRVGRDRRHRARDDREGLRLRLERGRRQCAPDARDDERCRELQLRRGSRHLRRRHRDGPLDGRPQGRRDRRWYVRATAVLPTARERQRLDAALRLAVRPASQPLDVGERRRGESTDRRRARRWRRHSPATPTRSSRPARSGSSARTPTSTSSSRSSTSCSRSPSS